MSRRVFCLGDDINTDYIIAGKYTKTLDERELALHIFEDLDPELSENIKHGDFIGAGWNFGCGSSREQAAIAIKASGIVGIFAKSFARIFFRNVINLGIPALICDTSRISEGDELVVEIEDGVVVNMSRNEKIPFEPLPPIMLGILREGGLVPYLLRYGDFTLSRSEI